MFSWRPIRPLCAAGIRIASFFFIIWSAFAPNAHGANIYVGYSSIGGTQVGGWIAQEAALFAKHGLDVGLVFNAGDRVIIPLVAGDTPIVTVGGPSAIAARLGSSSWPRYEPPARITKQEVFPDVIIIAHVFDTILYSLMVTPEIRSLAELRGKKIGANRFGSVTDLPLRYVLKQNGFDPGKDVTIVQIGSQAETLAALRAGSIQGGVMAPPATAEAKRLGMKELIKMATLGVEYPQTTIATTERFLRGNRDTVLRFTRAYVEGIHRFLNDREFSLRVIAKYAKIQSRSTLEATYDYYAPYVKKVPAPTTGPIKTVLEQLAAKDWRAPVFPPEDYVDGSVITELKREGFFQQVWR